MIEQDLNYVDSIVEEMTDFFEIKAVNLKLKEDKKSSYLSFYKMNKQKISENEITPIQDL